MEKKSGNRGGRTITDGDIDYSDVTPATGMNPDSKCISNTYANTMPYADIPTPSGNLRADPDKVIPGNESPTGVDELEQDVTENK